MVLREIARRTISGRGIIQLSRLFNISERGLAQWTRVEIWMVARKRPTSQSESYLWRPAQSLYSRVTFSSSAEPGAVNGAVLGDELHRYIIQRVYEWEDPNFVTASLIACATEKILLSIKSLGNALGASDISFTSMPVPTRRVCPVELVRVTCASDAIVDVVVLAENGFAQFQPPDVICGQFQPDGVRDDSPTASGSGNSLDTTPSDPSDDPPPSAAYDPTTSDNGETTPNNSPPPVPGTLGRLIYSGTVQTCQDLEPRPISGPSPNSYPAPITVQEVESGTCGNGAPFFNIWVTDGNGQTNQFELTALQVVPDYTIEYFNA